MSEDGLERLRDSTALKHTASKKRNCYVRLRYATRVGKLFFIFRRIPRFFTRLSIGNETRCKKRREEIGGRTRG